MTQRAGLPPVKPRAVALTFDAAGRPKLKPGWLERLAPAERTWVEGVLARRGFCPDGLTFEEHTNGYSG